MDRIKVISSFIDSVGYSEEKKILEIKIKKGKIYQYYSVPIERYIGLLNASSKGRYFDRYIRDRYRTSKKGF
ncbi:MAG: KTSC domain-containing protein [Ignavibacteriae bacterium]|nr:MAG: KTSC domain-containing protein [Ignavibacteriota bacterium]